MTKVINLSWFSHLSFFLSWSIVDLQCPYVLSVDRDCDHGEDEPSDCGTDHKRSYQSSRLSHVFWIKLLFLFLFLLFNMLPAQLLSPMGYFPQMKNPDPEGGETFAQRVRRRSHL